MTEPFLDRLQTELCAAAWREIESERRPRLILSPRALATGAVIAVIVVAGAWALRGLDDSADTPTRAHSAFAPALTAQFRVLRRAPAPRDAVPAESHLRLRGGMMPAADYAGGLRLADGVWAVPYGSRACLLTWHDGGGTIGCRVPDLVVGGRLFAVEPRPGFTRVRGLLPDGAHDISLTRSDGGVVSIGLSGGNLYSVRVAGEPRKLRFTSASGKRHTVTILAPPKPARATPVPSVTPVAPEDIPAQPPASSSTPRPTPTAGDDARPSRIAHTASGATSSLGADTATRRFLSLSVGKRLPVALGGLGARPGG